MEKLNSINEVLVSSVKQSCFANELEVFEDVQVHAGCGGCYGTQISCRVNLVD